MTSDDDHEEGATDQVAPHRRGLHPIGDAHWPVVGGLDDMAGDLMREEREERLRRVAGRPVSGETPQNRIGAPAVQGIGVGPEGAAELDAGRDLDPAARLH